MKNLEDLFIFRNIKHDEAREAATIESICFPPNEACTFEHISERVRVAPENFLVAVDRESGKIAGFLNGLATDEEKFRDEFFVDESLHNPSGKNVMLLGLDVLPEYRGRGLAKEIMVRYVRRESEAGREKLILTCLDEKVGMYIKMGYEDLGMADSSWGGEAWHEMVYHL